MISALSPAAKSSESVSTPSVPALRATSRAAWKKLLPREHGSWALAFEPVALGLLAGFSVAGLWLTLAVAAAFLSRRPWQLHHERPEARTALFTLAAVVAAALLAMIKLVGVVAALPLLAALPFGLVFAWYDSKHAARDAVPEIAGAAAFACVPAALALCAGLRTDQAWALTALMLARAIPTVCVVRSYVRSRKDRGTLPARVTAIATSLAVVPLIAALVHAHLCPPAALILVAFLAARALWLLGPWAPDFSAKRLGIIECALGATYVGVIGVLN